MKKIPLDERYFIDINGKVYSRRSGNFRELSYQRDISGKYKRVCLGKRHYLVHRLVAITYFPIDCPETLEVNHINGEMLDNRLVNLEWVTKGENQKHAYRTGLKTLPKGEDNANHKLSNECVVEIYQNLLEKVSIKSLADYYNVSSTTISRIKKKEAWIHITENFKDIKIKMRATPLDHDKIEIVKQVINSGMDFKTAKACLSFEITQDQFYRIKSLL